MQELEPIKIVSLVRLNGELSFILNRMPKFEYELLGSDTLWGRDGDFISRFGYRAPTKAFEAFGGREFSIPMKDGTTIEASGQWWDDNTEQVEEHLGCSLVRVSYATLEKLNECFVFFGGCFLPVEVRHRLVNEYMERTDSVIQSYDTLRDSIQLVSVKKRLGALSKEYTTAREYSYKRHGHMVAKVKEQHTELERLRMVEANYKEVMLLKFEELVYEEAETKVMQELLDLLMSLGVVDKTEAYELVRCYSHDIALPTQVRLRLIEILRDMNNKVAK